MDVILGTVACDPKVSTICGGIKVLLRAKGRIGPEAGLRKLRPATGFLEHPAPIRLLYLMPDKFCYR